MTRRMVGSTVHTDLKDAIVKVNCQSDNIMTINLVIGSKISKSG